MNQHYIEPEYRGRVEADAAFDAAIASGRLSSQCGAPNYAGDYMYMGTDKGRAHFKHRMTRRYLP